MLEGLYRETSHSKCWRGCGEKNPQTLLVGVQTGAGAVEGGAGAPQTVRTELLYDSAISLLGTYPKNLKIFICKDVRAAMFSAASFTMAKTWKQANSPSIDGWIKKLGCIYTMGGFAAMRKDEIRPFVTRHGWSLRPSC